jgi:hypothetical protein
MMKRQALGEQRISGSIWKPGPSSSFSPQLDSMVVSRGPECKRTRRGGRKKKAFSCASVSLSSSSLSFFQHIISVCVDAQVAGHEFRLAKCCYWPSNIQTDRQVSLSLLFGWHRVVCWLSHILFLWKIRGKYRRLACVTILKMPIEFASIHKAKWGPFDPVAPCLFSEKREFNGSIL